MRSVVTFGYVCFDRKWKKGKKMEKERKKTIMGNMIVFEQTKEISLNNKK